VACPTSFGVACSGRGLCNNNATCSCFAGFVGAACQLECTGGALKPCSGNGKCLPDATCNCSVGFYGEACDVTCGVGVAGLVCSGRGKCDASGVCVCQSGMAGVISAYDGHACQNIVYNRTGLRVFSTAVSSQKLAVAEPWVSALAPVCIAAMYFLVILKRALNLLFAGRFGRVQ
jgi:hypothetical protein